MSGKNEEIVYQHDELEETHEERLAIARRCVLVWEIFGRDLHSR